MNNKSKEKKSLIRVAIVLIFILVVIVIIITADTIHTRKLEKQFCEQRGYSFYYVYTCYKIINNTYLEEREIGGAGCEIRTQFFPSTYKNCYLRSEK